MVFVFEIIEDNRVWKTNIVSNSEDEAWSKLDALYRTQNNWEEVRIFQTINVDE